MTSLCRTYLSGLLLLVTALFPAGCSGQVKEPAVAGAFYPGDRTALEKTVDRYLAQATMTPVEGRLIALMAPHAGYAFSGQVAAFAYDRLKGSGIDTVILIGPSHHSSFAGAAVYTGDGMRTPLGTVKVNTRMARALVEDKAGISAAAAPFAKEHSLEVQLPFMQRTLKDFTVVPILIGAPTRASYTALTEKLTAQLAGNPRALLVISTDLSHYHDRKTAGTMDAKVLDAAARLATGDLERLLSTGEGEMCGGIPVIYALQVIRNLGGTNGILFRQADSGDVTGDGSRVVGYGAMGFYQQPLSAAHRGELLALAKASVIARVSGKKLPEQVSDDPRLKADGAAFVTLKEKNGNLRGCIGNIQPVMPLYQSVIRNGAAACSSDPRFPPVQPAELPNLDIEVTVLSPLEPLSSISEIRIGTHGLYLEAGHTSSVFLPQVPVEQGWNLDTYLAELAMKAGLPKDGWKSGKLYRFTAEIIH